jgi:hypothetical protein
VALAIVALAEVSQRVICADASDFLLPSESDDDFHDAHDNIQKPSHEEQIKKGACETANEQECDDPPPFEHGFLAAHRAVFRPVASGGRFPMLTPPGLRQRPPAVDSELATCPRRARQVTFWAETIAIPAESLVHIC